MSNTYGQPYGYGQQVPYGQGQPQMPMPNQYGQGYYQPPPQGYYGQQPQEQKININDNKPNNGTTSNGEWKKSKIEFNDHPRFQDLWATLVYIATVAVTIVIAVLAIPNLDLNNVYGQNSTSSSNSSSHSNKYGNNYNYYYKRSDRSVTNFDILILLGTSLGSSAIITLLYIILVQRFTGKMIKGTFIISIILNFIYAAITFMASPIMGIVMIIFAGLYVLCYFFWRSRIPFAKVVLKTVCAVTRKYPATIFVGFLGCIIAAIWYGVIGVTTVAAMSYWGHQNSSIAYVVYVFLLFSFYFTSQVINNTVHVTIAGVFATYYFRGVHEPGTNEIEVDVKHPTLSSLKRALTTSFGSVCFGSLIISLVNTLRALATQTKHEAAEDENYLLCLLACCVECILSCLEDGIEYFNVYAFTEVAIYGKPYCQAAKDTWTLCKARGIEALINDNIIGNVLGIGALAVACLSAAVTFAVGFVLNVATATAGIYAAIAFLAGLMIFSVVAQVINSGVATTFVCLCEDPDALRQTKPELWEKVRDSYPSIVY